MKMTISSQRNVYSFTVKTIQLLLVFIFLFFLFQAVCIVFVILFQRSFGWLLNRELQPCAAVSYDRGPVIVRTDPVEVEDLSKYINNLLPGGHWMPSNCMAVQKVAIIVPYRLRKEHLGIWLRHMHPFLQQQNIDYRIIIVEQKAVKRFNRAMLLNVGFLEASKMYPFDCYIFHDVDMLPEDTRNLYICGNQPRHMSVAMSRVDYQLPYEEYFGGVVSFTPSDFKKLNGFSNEFWGWGGEDDDMMNRLKYNKMNFSRYSEEISRYRCLKHKRVVGGGKRFKNLREGPDRFASDGLNSASYQIYGYEYYDVYTWIRVNLLMPDESLADQQ